MKNHRNKGGLFLLWILLIGVSCGDADLFDTDKWSGELEGWEPEVTLSVVQGNFSLWDLINQRDNSVIIKEGNSLIIQYTKEGIDTVKVSEVFDMPEEDVAFEKAYEMDPGVTGRPLGEPVVISLELENTLTNIPVDCDLRSMEFSADLLLPQLGFMYDINSIKINQTLVGQDLKVGAGGGQLPVEACRVDFAESGKIMLEIKMIIPKGTRLQQSALPLNFALNQVNYKWVKGKISLAEPVTIQEGSFNMDIDFLDEIGGSFRFTRPQLQLILKNTGIGVPLQVMPEFTAFNKAGKSVTLKNNADNHLIALGNPLNQTQTEYLTMDAGNSNIVDFLALPPQGDITYRGTIKVNPGAQEDNVVYKDGSVVIDAYVKVPFDLHADSLVYQDTLTDIDIDEKWAKKIETGRIRINAVKNELPLSIYIPELVFLDENNKPVNTVKISGEKNRIEAATSNSFLEFELTRQQAHDLGRTKNILLLAVAATNDQDKTGVPILADAKLEFNLVVEAQAVLEDYNDL